MRPLSRGDQVSVIGAGLSGLALSRALVRSGIRVLLHERGPTVAAQASGNPAGIYKPILTRSMTAQSRLSFLALPALRAELGRLRESGFSIRQGEGLLQLAISDEEEARMREAFALRQVSHPKEMSAAVLLNAQEASDRVGYGVTHGGVLWQHGGWVSPRDLCSAWADELGQSADFELRLNSDFPLDPTRWTDEKPGAAVFLCAGPQTRSLSEFERFPHQLIRGQLSELQFTEDPGPRLAVSFHEYVIPLGSGAFVIGATHDRGDESDAVRSEDHARLLERFGQRLPATWAGRAELARPASLGAGVRFTSQSRIPFCGALLQSSARAAIASYALTAQGSRGILWSALLGDVLAQWAQGESSAIDGDTDLCHLLRGPSVAVF